MKLISTAKYWWSKKPKLVLRYAIIVSSVLSILIHSIVLTQIETDVSILPNYHFFGDGMYKWNQIEDLESNQFTNIRCEISDRTYDPEGKLFAKVGVIAIKDGECYYLYPYALSFWMSLPKFLGGAWGIVLFQHLLLCLILLLMIEIGLVLKISWNRIAMALILFRFGTAASMMQNDLEEHITSAFFFILGLKIILTKKMPRHYLLAGFVISLSFLFRPEMIIIAILMNLFVYFYLEEIKDQNRKQLLIFYISATITVLFGCFILNYILVGHPLGVKVYDNIHNVSVFDRIKGIYRNSLFYPPFYANSLFFQMPIFVFLFHFIFCGKIFRNSFLTLLFSLPLILIVSPPTPTFSVGVRFLFFLSPILILLSIEQGVQFNSNIRFKLGYTFLTILMIWSVLISLTANIISWQVYKRYDQNYHQLEKIGSGLHLVSDTFALQSFADLYHKRRVLYVPEIKDWQSLLIQFQKTEKISEYTTVRSSLTVISFETLISDLHWKNIISNADPNIQIRVWEKR